jgi:cob(I)alamin adenosyltransferase
MEKNGLVIVHTGDGKGKTTAALGLAMRAWGDGLRILILQFIKGSWKYGELKAIERLGDRIEVHQCGYGFTQKAGSNAVRDQEAAAAALQCAREALQSGKWDMLILDELNYAVKFGLLDVKDVLDMIDKKPPEMHLILTGRDACPDVIEAADLVTEMHLIKHPFQKGIKAQKGIEF